jgi:response regulator RpfG family c-di-GMP phosphodiesterase
MPEMNGVDFIKKIREKNSSNLRLKIILISTFTKDNLDVQRIANSLKIDKIIEKPVRLEHFKEEVEKLMK